MERWTSDGETWDGCEIGNDISTRFWNTDCIDFIWIQITGFDIDFVVSCRFFAPYPFCLLSNICRSTCEEMEECQS